MDEFIGSKNSNFDKARHDLESIQINFNQWLNKACQISLVKQYKKLQSATIIKFPFLHYSVVTFCVKTLTPQDKLWENVPQLLSIKKLPVPTNIDVLIPHVHILRIGGINAGFF